LKILVPVIALLTAGSTIEHGAYLTTRLERRPRARAAGAVRSGGVLERRSTHIYRSPNLQPAQAQPIALWRSGCGCCCGCWRACCVLRLLLLRLRLLLLLLLRKCCCCCSCSASAAAAAAAALAEQVRLLRLLLLLLRLLWLLLLWL
jgi:hypothetical protein